MTLIKPGRYTAYVKDHAITETKDGNPQATVVFEFEVDGSKRELTWFGSFKEKAVEHTIKGLIVCGLSGANPAGPLEIGREVSIVVATDKDLNGNERSVIRWVNRPGGIMKPMDHGEASTKLERFAGLVMATKQTLGEKENDADKVPF
jgi:hypothetical protein